MGGQEPDGFREMQPERLNNGDGSVAIDEEKVAKTLRAAELSMKDVTGHEMGVIVGRDGLVIKAGIVGEKDIIRPPKELVKNNIFSHTHHNGMCNLSTEDVIAFIKDGGYEVRVVTPDGRFASLKRGNGELNRSLGEDMQRMRKGTNILDEIKKRTMEKYGKSDRALQNKELEAVMNEWLSGNANKYGYVFTQGRHEL